MLKKLIVLCMGFAMGLAWAQEPASSSTASTSKKRTFGETAEATSSTSADTSGAEKRARNTGVEAMVKAYFVHQDNIANELDTLFSNIKKQILVAMYWITDDNIIDKLIALKIRGIDVRIIFDESSFKEHPFLLSRFIENNILPIENNILPIVYPSQIIKNSITSLMHNKFLVIDSAIVLTGSANFTKQAFRGTKQNFNYENIVIIHSDNIAHEYNQIFFDIKKDTLNTYISLFINRSSLPEWIKTLLLKFYQRENDLKEIIYSRWAEFNSQQKIKLQTFFKWRPSTPGQNRFLQERSISVEGMPSEYAYKLIGNIIKQEKEAKKLKRKSDQSNTSLD